MSRLSRAQTQQLLLSTLSEDTLQLTLVSCECWTGDDQTMIFLTLTSGAETHPSTRKLKIFELHQRIDSVATTQIPYLLIDSTNPVDSEDTVDFIMINTVDISEESVLT